jgi:hypothetical protein
VQRGISAAWEPVEVVASEAVVLASPVISMGLLIVVAVVVVVRMQVIIVEHGPLLIFRIFRFFGIRS